VSLSSLGSLIGFCKLPHINNLLLLIGITQWFFARVIIK